MNEHLTDDERRKREERDRKKAEVRVRLEAAAAAASPAKKKGGFITPERKKKLRLLLRRKAAEELKRQQEVKANERRRVIAERVGEPKSLENMSEDQLSQLIKQYHNRLSKLEDEKFELEYIVRVKDYEIAETTGRVCDMRGKFVRPPLKKTPKYEAKIERMILNARKEIGFTVALKAVKKDQMADSVAKDCRNEPEWSWKNKGNVGQSQPDAIATTTSNSSNNISQQSARDSTNKRANANDRMIDSVREQNDRVDDEEEEEEFVDEEEEDCDDGEPEH